MQPDDYDAWYDTPRGRWIGNTEYALAARGLAAQPGDSLLDIGCGTGWFTRRAAADDLVATGLDPNAAWLDFARAHSSPALNWVEGDARDLPFADASFDHVMSIAALCFVDDARRAVAEAVRVTRRRFVFGWLNRSSLLYWQKGRHGGSVAYRGARWHTAREVREMFAGLPVKNLKLRSVIFLPSGTGRAIWLEHGIPEALPWGGLLLMAGEKTSVATQQA
ncbi:MAG: class I SAM-dependent methyltransferase [Thiobacillus sp.]|nr:class I SAM-dependent methyltransferase [Thiobacillus sp.]